jgi:uncharacterized membrane protein YbaN (DUF454 family)
LATPPFTQDYSADVRLAGSGAARWWFLGLGHLSLVLAVLGAILPLLPCTPFLLLAAACYARGSIRFYNWLLNNRHFGPAIINWKRDRSISVKHKVTAIVMIVASIAASVIYTPHIAGKITTTVLGIVWVTVMLRIRTKR